MSNGLHVIAFARVRTVLSVRADIPHEDGVALIAFVPVGGAPAAHDRVGHGRHVTHLRDVVHAHDSMPAATASATVAAVRKRARRRRARSVCRASTCATCRPASENRARPGGRARRAAPDLLRRLAEADAGVENDAFGRDPRAHRPLGRAASDASVSSTTSRYVFATVVHDDDGCGRCRREFEERRVEPPDRIENVAACGVRRRKTRACTCRRRARLRRARGRRDHREQASGLFVTATADGRGASIRRRCQEYPRPPRIDRAHTDRLPHIRATVAGKRIGRHIDDAHDVGRAPHGNAGREA